MVEQKKNHKVLPDRGKHPLPTVSGPHFDWELLFLL